jgi:ABC-type oligopeptide transport system substrate-binding subunit
MNLKKYVSIAMAAALLAGCGSGSTGAAAAGTASTKKSNDLFYVYTTDVKTTDYLITQNAGDNNVNQNLVEGLTEPDPYNHYIGDLAETFEANDDKTVWTFHLRDAKWVTNNGEEYGAVTADDFVAGLQHAADFQSATLPLVSNLVKGLSAYMDGTDTDFSHVGVKAIDDKTVEYTLEKPAPYFDSMASYAIFWPVNREFLESQGAGCKLGAPDTTSCSFGNAADPSTILYNGAYILTANDSKSQQKMSKNDAYWDAEHVYINNVTLVYDDGSDPNKTVTGFNQTENPYYMAVLLTSSDNFQQYLEQYKDNAYTGLQNAYTFGINFNMNRITYNYTEKADDKAKADTRKALLNTNFRLALKYGLDRVSYMAAAVDPSIAAAALRNIECPWNFVTTSDGTSYGKLVQDASTLGADLSEGQDPFYNAETAKSYLEKAKAELTDVTWPIHLDLMTDEASKTLVAQAGSLKQSIEASLGTDAVVIDVHSVDDDTYTNSSYNSTGPVDDDWDISTSTGWGYDYIDPLSYLNIFSPVNGDVLRQSMGLEFLADGDATNNAAIEASGLNEYQKLLDAASAITDDNDARYKAFAKAEAYILDNAIYIPVQTQTRAVNWRISREVPFLGNYQQPEKYKHRIIQDDPITAADYKAAYEQWQKDAASK